jgi:hypothetical protein
MKRWPMEVGVVHFGPNRMHGVLQLELMTMRQFKPFLVGF